MTYFGLRDYGIDPDEWPAVTFTPVAGLPEMTIAGCDPACEHEWGEHLPPHHPGQVEQTKWKNADAAGKGGRAASGQYCQKCGGWRGSHGSEPDVWSYVAHEVLIFRAVRRVLHQTGVCFINLGGSYASNGTKMHGDDVVRLRQDLSKEEIAYVLSELAKAEEIADITTDGLE